YRASRLRSARSAEALSVWVSAASTVVAAAGSRVSAQHRSDVAAGTIAARLQKHRRVPPPPPAKGKTRIEPLAERRAQSEMTWPERNSDLSRISPAADPLDPSKINRLVLD